MDADSLRAWFHALGTSAFESVLEHLTEDIVLVFPGTRFGGRVEGRRKVAIFLKRNQRLFRDGLRFEVHLAGVLGERAVVQWTNAGVLLDGRPYANRGVTLFVLRDGRIARIDDYLDTEKLAETWPG